MDVAGLGAVPWKDILLAAPSIVESAHRLCEGLSKRHRRQTEATPGADLASAVADVKVRLEALEGSQTRQAELIARMAQQEEALSQGLRSVSARLTLLLWLSGGALVAASAAVVLAVVR